LDQLTLQKLLLRNDFALGVAMWENYSEELKKQLLIFLPYWLSNESIFAVDSSELQVCKKVSSDLDLCSILHKRILVLIEIVLFYENFMCSVEPFFLIREQKCS